MKKKLRKYKVGLDSTTYAISLVESPAIEEDFIYMNSQEPVKIQLSNDEKHMIYGAVLVPDKPIYRISEDGDEYYLEFSKDSIEKMAQEYLKEHRQENFTIDHEDDASELYVVESWIKDDMYKDKSVAIGLSENLPVGAWIVGVKVNNVDTWQKIKNGELKGFSVESLVHLEDFAKQEEKQVNFENQDMGSFLNEIRTMISDALATKPVEPVTEHVEEQPVEATETPSEEPKPIEVTNPTPEENNEPVEPVNEPQVEDNHLTELIENLRAELEALKGQNSKLQDKVKELSKEPSAKPITTTSSGNKGDSYADWREKMRKLIN